MENSSSPSTLTKRRKSPAPCPTYWIERQPDSSPPPDVLLLLLGWVGEDETEEASPMIATGFYSSKIEQYLNVDHQALEQDGDITHYHVIQKPDGTFFYL